MTTIKQPLTKSRAHSCANLSQHHSSRKPPISNKQRQSQLIEHLLQKKTSHSKKVFTDQTTYTYKPQISELPLDLYPQTRSHIEISKQQIFQRLVDNMKAKQDSFKLLKLKNEEQQFKQTCSFVPQISNTSKAIILAKLKGESCQQKKQPFKRLYEEGISHKIQRQKQYMSAQQNNLTSQHTFQPEINPISKQILNNESRNLQPIFVRFQQVMERKRVQQKLLQQQQNKQIQEQAQVKVQNKKTLEILENNPNYQSEKGNVVKRLLDNYFKTKQQKVHTLITQQEQQLKKECPFKPKLNSQYLLMNASTFDPDQCFLDRQKEFEEGIKQNLEMRANELVPSFRPEINRLSQLICKSREGQSLEEKVNRLHYEPLIQRQVQLQQLETSLYKQCRFHPQINVISRALQGPLKPHTCQCQPAPVTYNFIPEINKKSRQMKNNKSVQIESRRKREENASKIKMEKEYNELVECTFQPKIKSLNRGELGLNENRTEGIPGVREFVENRNRAVQMKVEDEKYKEKIFNLEKRYRPKTCTAVQEFKLSHNGQKARQKML